jgi:lipopolysaccharide export system protein LptC
MNRIYASIGFLFVLVVLVNIPTWFEEEPTPSLDTKEQANRPNYQAEGMLSTIYNLAGDINHQVFAEHMEHYEKEDVTLFKEPEYTVYTADEGSPWQMQAKSGTLFGENLIHLNSDVEIKSLNQSDFVRSIYANHVEIDLETRTMTSNFPVIINGNNFVINSEGFSANLATKQFELTNHVRTIYDPTQQ